MKNATKRTVAIICLITVILTLCSCAPKEITLKSPITANDTIRVMSFNIRCIEYAKRKNIVPQLILEYSPDTIGLQECTYKWYKNLTKNLENYEFIGVGRDTGDLNGKDCGEIAAILFRKDKYKLIESDTFWLSETPNEVSFGWDAACRRVCTWAILENIETGERMAHVNTHLDHMGENAIKNGTKMVIEKAQSFDMLTVVTGDFNFNKEYSAYEIIENSLLRNTQDIAEKTMDGKTFHNYEGGEEGSPIDYILVNDGISSVSEYKIVRDMYGKKYSSDHYPIYADITIE